MSTAIWWLRRDLRLTDNQALYTAIQHSKRVVPVFILDPVLLNSQNMSQQRLAFLLNGLRALDTQLQERGSRLIVRHGPPKDVLRTLLEESNANIIFAERDVSPFAIRRDSEIAASLPLQLTGGLTVYPSEAISKADGTPYIVYTPFSKAWKRLPIPTIADILPTPDKIYTPDSISSQPIPDKPVLSTDIPFQAGEVEAKRRLSEFSGSNDPPIYHYATDRNLPSIAGTSSLSPYLRFGMISAQQAVVAARIAMQAASSDEALKGAETWLNELIWREFYISILHHFPDVLQYSFRANRRNIAWLNDEATFLAWCQGQTGYPIVDAAMRQLVQTGWMHNRTRMIVASFLIKDLLIDWRWGERWFMQHLIDGDPAANNGGWQWTAGTGTDAAPYFRIFNPTRQSAKFDPTGNYIRTWVPELINVPDEYIHEPHRMHITWQMRFRCVIGQDYPPPIVDHYTARDRVLAAYKAAERN